MVVWVDGWQLECCGDAFAVGWLVEWTVHQQVDRTWITSVLGETLAATVTHAEEHHGRLPQDAPVTRGVVTRIRAVSCDYAPDPAGHDDGTLVAVRGSGVVTDVQDSGRAHQDDGPGVSGYLVDLHPVGG